MRTRRIITAYEILVLFVAAVLSISVAERVYAAGEGNDGRLDIELHFSQRDTGGNLSNVFTMSVRNISDDVVSVLNVDNVSFEELAFNVVVRALGHSFDEESGMFVHPRLIGDKDIVLLQPGEKRGMVVTPTRFIVDHVAPGRYAAYVEYWPDPLNANSEKYVSPEIEFEIVN